jgi:LDH2 family malate/lactate/ureidoglycolate dehydrogenase
MSGGAVLGMVESKAKAKNWGHTVIAINPALLTDAFPSKVESVLATVRASGEGIRLPGDKSGAIAATNTETGTLPLTNSLWESLQKNSKL